MILPLFILIALYDKYKAALAELVRSTYFLPVIFLKYSDVSIDLSLENNDLKIFLTVIFGE
jgi:hypothetical protein